MLRLAVASFFCLSITFESFGVTTLAVVNRGDTNIYFMNPETGAITGFIDTGVTGIGALAADDQNQLFYFTATNDLLYSATYDGSRITFIAGISGATNDINSLGYDLVSATLYGVFQSTGLFEIDVATGVTTLARPITTPLEGFDIDPSTGIAYFSDRVSVNSIFLPDGIPRQVVTHSGLGVDFDGLAILDGDFFLVNDEANSSIYRIDSSGAVVATFPTPFSASGLASGATIFSLPIPEPSSSVLFLSCSSLLFWKRRRRT